MSKAFRRLFVSLLLAGAASVQAALPTVSGSASAGTPGGHVVIELVFDYGSGFEVMVEDFKFQYDPGVLEFVAAGSSVQIGGAPKEWLTYVGELQTLAQGNAGMFVVNANDATVAAPRRGYALSFLTDGSVGHPRDGVVRYALGFDVKAGAPIGTTKVTFDGSVMYDLLEQEFVYPDGLAVTGLSVNVTAVPEPAQALLLLAGLGIIAARYGRSRKPAAV